MKVRLCNSSILPNLSISFDAIGNFTGYKKDYMVLSLRDGQLQLAVDLGSGVLETKIDAAPVRFDDGRWHKVQLQREVREVGLSRE